MNILKELKKINPNIVELLQQDIVDELGNNLGSRCYVMDSNAKAFAGGTASSRETALRIAVAEAFERSLFDKISEQDSLRNEFDLIKFPSTSGFAAGFDEKSTRFRAVCEGVERWAWSKWIDDRCMMPEDRSIKKISKLAKELLADFEDCMWFKKDFEIILSPEESINLTLTIFLGFKDDGIFPGSRVSTSQDDLHEHPIIEAHRNLINFKLAKNNYVESRDIIEKRTMFFGENKQVALAQVNECVLTNWPKLELNLLKKFETNIPGIFLYRCLFKNFIGWHDGAVERFVY